MSLFSDVGFMEDKEGDIWITNIKGGLKRFDRRENKFYSYEYDTLDKNKLQHEFTVGINFDKYDSVWVSTWGGGLYKLLDKEKGIFRNYVHDPKDPNSIVNDVLVQVYVGDIGDLWILGTSGFSIYNYELDNFTTYRVPYDPEPYTYDNVLVQMIPDGSGNLWIHAWEGVYRYKPGSGSIIHFSSDLVAYPTAVVTGRDGIVWISNVQREFI